MSTSLPRSKVARVAAFVLVVAVVVAGSIATPYVPSGDGEPASYPEYDPAKLVPDRAESRGQPRLEAANDTGVVLIDMAHSNRFEVDDIQPLISAITATGYEVELLSGNDDFDAALSRADAFVVIAPGSRYTAEEVQRVESFVDAGGRLAMLGEPRHSQIRQVGFFAALVTVSNRLGPLSSQFGIEFGTGYLYNMADRDGNFQNVFANPRGGSILGRGVDRAAFYTATQVEATGADGALLASNGTRNSNGDAAGTYAVGVVKGNVLAIGDTTFLERGNYNVVDNDRLVANVARFLTSGDRVRTLTDYPAVVDEDPSIAYTSVELLDAAQRLGNDVAQAGDQPTLELARDTVFASETDVLITTFEYLRRNDIRGTGITLAGDRVQVPGYESTTKGLIVVRAPATDTEFDVVIVADTPERAARGADVLVDGSVGQHAIGPRSAVLRTNAAPEPPEIGNESG